MAHVCSMVAAAIRPADSAKSSNLVEKESESKSAQSPTHSKITFCENTHFILFV